MFNAIMTAAFKNGEMTNHVTVGIGHRVIQGVTNSSLSCQMNNTLKLLFCK